MSETSRLALPLLAADQAQKHVTHNEALMLLDALVQAVVKDRDLVAPPASPAEGDAYVPAAGASGAWAGREGDIAVFQGGAWRFVEPDTGWTAFVEDEGKAVVHLGGAWVAAETVIGALQNLTLLGVGTTADATNPFAAKVNKALWTAKTVAEGGDGDLRFTFNKESAADVASLLFQSGFSGRAEVGLVGDDDLAVKVSADGSSWTTALSVDRATGGVTVPSGSAAAPGLGVGQADTGLFQSAGRLHGTVEGVEVWRAGSAGVAIGAGFDATEALHLRRTGGNARIRVQAEGGAAFIPMRYSNDASAPSFVCQKFRGTIASPAAISQNDRVFSLEGHAYDGATLRVPFDLRGTVVAATPSASDMEARFQMLLAPPGSVTAAEALRVDHATGLSLYTNVVVDQNRHLRLRSYTLATLPSAATAAGQVIYCSDLGGGGGPLVSNGAGWVRLRNGVLELSTDADFTLTTLSSGTEVFHTGTLTADRAVTLSTANVYNGSRFRITRTGGGAFNLDIGTGPLKALAANQWAEFVYGSSWKLAAAGSL